MGNWLTYKILFLGCQDEKKKEESLQWLQNAASQGSCQAAFDLWKLRFCDGPTEPYSRLERLRELRDCATAGDPDAQLTLALEYAKGNLGGITKKQVAEFVSQVHVSLKLKAVHWICEKLSSYKIITFIEFIPRCYFAFWTKLVQLSASKLLHVQNIPCLFPDLVCHIGCLFCLWLSLLLG